MAPLTHGFTNFFTTATPPPPPPLPRSTKRYLCLSRCRFLDACCVVRMRYAHDSFILLHIWLGIDALSSSSSVVSSSIWVVMVESQSPCKDACPFPNVFKHTNFTVSLRHGPGYKFDVRSSCAHAARLQLMIRVYGLVSSSLCLHSSSLLPPSCQPLLLAITSFSSRDSSSTSVSGAPSNRMALRAANL